MTTIADCTDDELLHALRPAATTTIEILIGDRRNGEPYDDYVALIGRGHDLAEKIIRAVIQECRTLNRAMQLSQFKLRVTNAIRQRAAEDDSFLLELFPDIRGGLRRVSWVRLKARRKFLSLLRWNMGEISDFEFDVYWKHEVDLRDWPKWPNYLTVKGFLIYLGHQRVDRVRAPVRFKEILGKVVIPAMSSDPANVERPWYPAVASPPHNDHLDNLVLDLLDLLGVPELTLPIGEGKAVQHEIVGLATDIVLHFGKQTCAATLNTLVNGILSDCRH